jgi:ubiquinone/menaquinone biosynthesis C-methylase UbiE
MVDEARILNRDLIRSGQAEFHLAHAESLPFPHNSFHKLFTINTIYFWDDPARVLAEFRRVLKPAGTLIISLRPGSVMEKYPFVQYGFHLFSDNDVGTLLRENKFAVEQIIRRKEPDQVINGESIAVESLIVVARGMG